MGVKKALCIGVNEYKYWLNAPTLEGCVNDANLWAKVLHEKYGFTIEGIITNEDATFDNLKEKICDFLEHLNEDDLGIIFFSGHGSRDYPEVGICHETIYFHDKEVQGTHYLRTWINNCKQPNSRLIFIADACHSATLTDVDRCCSYAVYGSHINRIAGQAVISQIDFEKDYVQKDFKRFIENQNFELDFTVSTDSIQTYVNEHYQDLDNKVLEKAIVKINEEYSHLKDMLQSSTETYKIREVAKPYIEDLCNPEANKGLIAQDTANEFEMMIPACLGDDKAYEALLPNFFGNGNKKYGVFTHAALTILLEETDITYKDFFELLKTKLNSEVYTFFGQKPFPQGHPNFTNQILFSL